MNDNSAATKSADRYRTAQRLAEAYERLHVFGPEYGGDEEGNHGMTNHGPMAVEVVLRRELDLDVGRWLDRYVRRLDASPPAGRPITAWESALGDARRLPDWTATFDRELSERPWTDVLATWWPRLLPGLLAGTTHGLIRVGHAVRALRVDDTAPARAELAHGLAFWAARWRTLPSAQPRGNRPADSALDGVVRLSDQSGLVAHRAARLADTPGWTASVRALRPVAAAREVPDRLTELIAAAGRAYVRSGPAAPVLLVHTATAPNAVLQTLPALPVGVWAASHDAVWRAAAAVHAMYAPAGTADGMDAWAGAVTSSTEDPADILARAADHGDEHVLKFADTLVDAYQRHADPLLLAAADRARELIAQP